MKKEGIQTRKRKPKNHSGMSGSLAGPSGMHKTEIKSNLLGESSVSKFVIKFLFRSLSPPPQTRLFVYLETGIDRRSIRLVYLRIGRIVVSRISSVPCNSPSLPLSISLLSLSLSLSCYIYVYVLMEVRFEGKMIGTRESKRYDDDKMRSIARYVVSWRTLNDSKFESRIGIKVRHGATPRRVANKQVG